MNTIRIVGFLFLLSVSPYGFAVEHRVDAEKNAKAALAIADKDYQQAVAERDGIVASGAPQRTINKANQKVDDARYAYNLAQQQLKQIEKEIAQAAQQIPRDAALAQQLAYQQSPTYREEQRINNELVVILYDTAAKLAARDRDRARTVLDSLKSRYGTQSYWPFGG